MSFPFVFPLETLWHHFMNSKFDFNKNNIVIVSFKIEGERRTSPVENGKKAWPYFYSSSCHLVL